MNILRFIKRLRWQVYKDYYGRIRIAPMTVCAQPQWITFGSLWKCLKVYFKEIKENG